jgi:4-amino-4-deoxy-L-arabinose transferase-like glycosyltransferase
MRPPAARPRFRRAWILLAIIFLVGLALRVWGIAAPWQRIDDPPYAKQIYAVFQGYTSPDPQLFYPMCFAYIGGFLLKVIAWFGPKDFTLDQVLFISRILSAFMGALTILVVYRIGRRLFSEAMGLAAAALFSLSFVHILYSHQIVLDVPMTLFYALALLFCVRIYQDGRWGAYLAAAFFAGIATATKYNAVFAVLSILAAHVAVKRRSTRNAVKILFDRKLLAAAGASLSGFIAGHPYALLWARSFVQSTRTLARLVHETEWYLVLIKPKTLLGKLAETNYVKGIGNIVSAEGVFLAVLVVLGLVWLFLRRRKGSGFIALSGLFYFLGAIGFLGFSRLRDLSTLALFTSFFAAFGMALAAEALQAVRARRGAFAVLAAAVFLVLGLRSFGRVFTLAGDDTTAVAERWVRRNLPPKSVFGREWFTPELEASRPAFDVVVRPYLIYGDFPAFDKFDFVMAGSASYGFFYKYAKYYPDQVAVYDSLETGHERIKDIFGREIEFKNPEVKIYAGKVGKRAGPHVSLPTMPAWPAPAREWEVLDGSIYGQDTRTFTMAGGDRIERVFLSRARVREISVYVRGAGRAGRIAVRSGVRRRTITVAPGRDSVIRFRPSLSFPFFKYRYRVRLRASAELGPCRVTLRAGDEEIALEDFRSGDFERAAAGFERVLRTEQAGKDPAEIHLYLAACSRSLGRPDEEKRWREAFRAAPGNGVLAGLYRMDEDAAAWLRRFESVTGIDSGLFSEAQTLRLDAGALKNAIRLPPQAYAADIRFIEGREVKGKAGTVTVVFRGEGRGREESFPLASGPIGPDGISAATIVFRVAAGEETVSFRIDPGGSGGPAVDGVWIRPDLRSFFADKAALFGPELERP